MTTETGPSWDRYRELKADHDREWEAKRPKSSDYSDYIEWNKALTKWVFESSVSAPNKPNSEYANNH